MGDWTPAARCFQARNLKSIPLYPKQAIFWERKKTLYFGSSDGVHISNTQQTNPTEFEFTTPPTRQIPFFMTKFLHRALKLFRDIPKKSRILVTIPTWSRSCSLKLGKSMPQKRTAGPKERASVVPVLSLWHECSHLEATVLLLLYVTVFERKDFWPTC